VLHIQDSTFDDYNSTYKCKILETLTNLDNSAFRGGVIKASSSRINIIGSKFQFNYAFEGGVIHVENECKLFLKKILAEGNYA
jgi:hypothetical protein